MLSKKKVLPINELQPGMISSTDIYLEDRILIAKDVAISETMINKLKMNYIIESVEIYSDSNSNETLNLKTKTVKELQNTFNEFSLNLESIFSNISTDISSLKESKLDEIRAFSQRIQWEFNSTGLVIKNIAFYGSGNDSIYKHSINVAAISFILGKWLGLNEKELSLLTYSAILHDLGKIEINKNILEKNSPLTPEEYEIFKTHPVISYHLVCDIPNMNASVSRAILMHHERMDGSGYPLHAKADKIPKFSRILAIADLFDEVNSNRYSSEIRGPLDALRVIQEHGITKLDSNYCTMFLNHIVNFYMGENAILNDNRSCKIIQVHINDLTKPILLDDNGFLDLKKEKDLYVKSLIL